MDSTIVEAVLQNIGQQSAHMISLLQPTGVAITGSLLTIAIILYVVNLRAGWDLSAPTFEMIVWGTLALYCCMHWSDMVLWSVDASRRIIGLAIPDYRGPTDLFVAAGKVAARVWSEPEGWGLSVDGLVGAVGRHMLFVVAGFLVLVGLSVPSLLSILAEIELAITAILAPLLLGFMALGATREIGFSALFSLVRSSLQIVALGLISVLFSNAITDVVIMPGPNQVLDMGAIGGLTLLGLMSIMVAWQASGIAGRMVGGGGIGSLGLSAMTAPLGTLRGAVGKAA